MGFKIKKIGKKIGRTAKKASVGGGKALTIGGKVTTGVGKAANMYSPGQGDRIIAAGRTAKTGGRLMRETGRGNTAGNRKRVTRVGANVQSLRR